MAPLCPESWNRSSLETLWSCQVTFVAFCSAIARVSPDGWTVTAKKLRMMLHQRPRDACRGTSRRDADPAEINGIPFRANPRESRSGWEGCRKKKPGCSDPAREVVF